MDDFVMNDSHFEGLNSATDELPHNESDILSTGIKTEDAMDHDAMLFAGLNQMPPLSSSIPPEYQLIEEVQTQEYVINPNSTDSMQELRLLNDMFSSGPSYNSQATGTSVSTLPPFIQNFTIQPRQALTIELIPKESLLVQDYSKLPMEFINLVKNQQAADVKMMPDGHNYKYVLREGKYMKVWSCGICNKEFGHQYTLVRHLPTHTDERKFACNICGKAFRQMSTLSQHRAIHSAERPYVCEICHKTFNRVSTLISHRKTHTGLKPHCCHLCNKAFHQKGNLRNHIFTHTNERPYKCDVCSKGFNQMSNLMCHKMKAHHRVDKPRYTCQICGKEFQKRAGLRNHEQYQHGMQQSSDTLTPSNRTKYSNGVLVEPITTAAMQIALSTNQTPFALLRPLNGIPVLVRVLPAGNKQMLVPATAEDLKKHGQITITNVAEEGSDVNALSANENAATETKPGSGSTVQIKIPVVATVIQRRGTDGNMCMAVQSPGADSDNVDNSYVFTTTGPSEAEQGHVLAAQMAEMSNIMLENIGGNSADPSSSTVTNVQTEYQYMDETGNIISEEEYKMKTRMLELQQFEMALNEESNAQYNLANASAVAVSSSNDVSSTNHGATTMDSIIILDDNFEVLNNGSNSNPVY